jgi:hypothetical protein
MGLDADGGPGPGGEPGEGGGLPGIPELLAGFGKGGAWCQAAPSAALAAALEACAGPEGLFDGAGPDSLTGIVRQFAAMQSWAAAGLMGAMRAMMREDSTGRPLLRRGLGLPDGWEDSLNYEIAGALAMGPQSAQSLASLAWALGMRLPGTGRLLAGGVLTQPKARLIVTVFEPLSEEEAAHAEALILPELEGKTYFQVQRLAWRAALAVAPDVAGRRRSRAALTLPGGRQLAVRLDAVPVHDCDHSYQADSYQPGRTLRRIVAVRDRECTFPTCSRPAKESDFEHAIPFRKGGRTCTCNAGARSRGGPWRGETPP